MNSKLVQEIIASGSTDQAVTIMRARRNRILDEIAEDFTKATDEVMLELAELNIALGDVPEAGSDGN